MVGTFWSAERNGARKDNQLPPTINQAFVLVKEQPRTTYYVQVCGYTGKRERERESLGNNRNAVEGAYVGLVWLDDDNQR